MIQNEAETKALRVHCSLSSQWGKSREPAYNACLGNLQSKFPSFMIIIDVKLFKISYSYVR